MQLLSSWYESLTLFKPGNFKLFALVTLKSLVSTYKVWLKYWGWLVLGYIIMSTGVLYFPVVKPLLFICAGFSDYFEYQTSYTLLNVGCLLLFLLYVTLVLSVRPSTDIKNYSYFMQYFKHALYVAVYFVLLTGAWFGAFVAVASVGSLLLGLITASALQELLILNTLFFIFSALTLFFTLFLCDTHAQVMDFFKSLWRALKMLVYNLPACLLFSMFFLLIIMGMNGLDSLLRNLDGLTHYYIMTVLYAVVVMPLIVNVATNFYVKRIHEQFQFYFGRAV